MKIKYNSSVKVNAGWYATIAEAISSVPWQCGDKECEQQWHLSTYWTNDSDDDSSDGYAYTLDTFTDGDHEPCESYPDAKEERNRWREYWKYCVNTGTDPLGELNVLGHYLVKERYSIKLSRSLKGIILAGCKRRGKVLDHRSLPQHVQDFLLIQNASATWLDPLLNLSTDELKEAGIELRRWVPVTIEAKKPRVPQAVEREIKQRARKILRLTRQEK